MSALPSDSPASPAVPAVESMPVLAADDDPVSLRVLRQALKRWGFAPVTCADGTSALEALLRPDGPRVAVLDWEMPGLDGIDVVRQARASTPAASLYLLLLTGRAEAADIVRGLDAGADDYITKPFDIDVLRARVSVGTRMMALQRSLAHRIEDLAQAEARYRELVEGVGVAVWQADARTWQLSFLNRHGEDVIGHPIDRCVHAGDLWSRHIVPEDWPRLEQFRADLNRGDDVPAFEYRLIRADGRVVWLRDTVTVVRDPGGVHVVRGVTHDVSAQKLAEAEREATLQMQAHFVSFASHQLRTPLTAISWMLELAEHEEGLPEAAAEGIGAARLATARLTGLVNDLLDSARLESGRLTFDVEARDLVEITRGAIRAAQPLFARMGHELVEHVPDEPVIVHADARYAHEALVNLLSNAAKYTPEGGTVTVRIEVAERVVRWSVQDTGIGIPEAAQAQLFSKFYRASNAAALEVDGTGLGLYMVKLIVGRMHGRVWCESAENAGSTFFVELPLVREHAPADRTE
jgi:PAS domain S-box-containing protein